jgi:hypothetical protein
LTRENNKRRRAFKVRIFGLADEEISSVHGLISNVISRSPRSVQKNGRTFTVEVGNLDDQTQLLSLDEREIVGRGTIRVENILETMEISECLEFLINSVEVDEDLEDCRKVFSNSKVFAVGNKTKSYNKQGTGNGSQKGTENPESSVLQPSPANPPAAPVPASSPSLPTFPALLSPAIPSQPPPQPYYPFISNPPRGKGSSERGGKGKGSDNNFSQGQKGKGKGEGKGMNFGNGKGEGKGRGTGSS